MDRFPIFPLAGLRTIKRDFTRLAPFPRILKASTRVAWSLLPMDMYFLLWKTCFLINLCGAEFFVVKRAAAREFANGKHVRKALHAEAMDKISAKSETPFVVTDKISWPENEWTYSAVSMTSRPGWTRIITYICGACLM